MSLWASKGPPPVYIVSSPTENNAWTIELHQDGGMTFILKFKSKPAEVHDLSPAEVRRALRMLALLAKGHDDEG